MKARLLEFSFWCAAANWVQWKADFEGSSRLKELPVLKDSERFSSFLNEYGLRRLFPKRNTNSADVARKFLLGADSFLNQHGVDGVVSELANEVGKRHVSFVSKIAAFAEPKIYLASDQYARKGVAKIVHGSDSLKYKSYDTYLKDVNKAWDEDAGNDIKAYVSKREYPGKSYGYAFHRRVLDVFLMATGGRWSKFTS
jgi:hypothetical protein